MTVFLQRNAMEPSTALLRQNHPAAIARREHHHFVHHLG